MSIVRLFHGICVINLTVIGFEGDKFTLERKFRDSQLCAGTKSTTKPLCASRMVILIAHDGRNPD